MEFNLLKLYKIKKKIFLKNTNGKIDKIGTRTIA